MGEAAPGPWEVGPGHDTYDPPRFFVTFAAVDGPGGVRGRGDTTWMDRPTAELIAAMRNALPGLLLAARLFHDLLDDSVAAREALRYREALEAVAELTKPGELGRPTPLMLPTRTAVNKVARAALEGEP
jgi:hypothetical protein